MVSDGSMLLSSLFWISFFLQQWLDVVVCALWVSNQWGSQTTNRADTKQRASLLVHGWTVSGAVRFLNVAQWRNRVLSTTTVIFGCIYRMSISTCVSSGISNMKMPTWLRRLTHTLRDAPLQPITCYSAYTTKCRHVTNGNLEIMIHQTLCFLHVPHFCTL